MSSNPLKGLSLSSDSDEEPGMAGPKNDWVNQVFPFYELLRLLNFYLDLECWIISAGNTDRWHEIRRHQRTSWPVDLDFAYGKREERTRHNEEQFRRVMAEKKTICASFNGLSSLLVPVFRDGHVEGILQAGVFLKTAPDRGTILEMWKEFSGLEAGESNPAFLKYVRTLLECPVVEGPAYRALQEILELYAGVFSGEVDNERVCRRTEELKEKVIARHFPHQAWLDILVRNNRSYPPTWRVGRVTDWEKREMGFEKVPTTILAARIDDLGESHGDDLDLMLRNYHFQKEAYLFAQTLPDTFALPLKDYGMVFLTAPKAGFNEVQAKLEILDRIDSISKFASNRFKVKLLMGVGRSPVPEGNPGQVYQEAVTAMEFCGPLGRPILFYEDIRTNPTIPEPKNFVELSRELIEAYAQGAMGKTEAARNRYVEQILSQSSGRPENVRLHFFYVLGQVVDVLKKRSPLEEGNLLFLFKTVEGRLQEAGTIEDLIDTFRDSLKRFLDLTLKPLEGSQSIRFEASRKYIDENFTQDLKLEQVARENGFSVSVFGRGFKKAVGTGFASYLRKVRLDQAKKLLVTTRLPIGQVSHESGFGNLQYFFDVFKRSTGLTPQEFRGKDSE